MASRPRRMGTRGYANDPSIGQGLNNIAGMFGPPGGAEMFAYARANELAQQRAQQDQAISSLASLYGPEVAALARAGVTDIAKAYSGIDAYRRATAPGATVEGMTLPMLGKGEAFASTPQGAREAQAAQTGRTRLEQIGATDRTMLAPLGLNQTRVLPPSIAGYYGMPETQTGALEFDQGKSYRLPGGETVAGPTKPLTFEEVRGAALGRQPEATQAAVATSGINLEPILRDGKPTLATRAEAIGQTPVPDATKQQVFNAITGGRVTPVAVGPEGARPIAGLEPGTALAAPSAGAGEQGLGPTKTNAAAGHKIKGGIVSGRLLADEITKLADETPGAFGVPGTFLGGAQNAAAMLGELGAVFGQRAPDAKVTLDEVRAGLSSFTGDTYNPAYQKAKMLVGELAYTYAQMNNPTGEVSRQAYERSLDIVQSKWFANNQSAKVGAQSFRELLERKDKEADYLVGGTTRSPVTAPAGGSAPGVNPGSMSLDQLQTLDPKNLTPEQLKAAAARWRELEGARQ